MKCIRICTVVFLLVVFTSFVQKKKSKKFKKLPKYFVEIPGGYLYDSLIVGEHIIIRNDHPVKDSVETFFMSETEVTNGQYLLFLNSLKQKDSDSAYNQNLPDTTVWNAVLRSDAAKNFTEYYFRHPAYKDYPVVGITKTQSLAYCKWLGDSLNALHPELQVKLDLPTRNQWIRSARGDSMNQMYSMNWPRLQNSKGFYLYNHKVIEGQFIYRDTSSKKFLLVPQWVMESGSMLDNGWSLVHTKSYYPNDFGMYNLCGNVAEMIADDSIALGGSWLDPGFDIRIESAKLATKPSCLIGFRVVANIKPDSH